MDGESACPCPFLWLAGEERGFLARGGKGLPPCSVCPDFLQGSWLWESLVEPLEVQRALGMEQVAGRMLPFGATSTVPWELGLQQGWGGQCSFHQGHHPLGFDEETAPGLSPNLSQLSWL